MRGPLAGFLGSLITILGGTLIVAIAYHSAPVTHVQPEQHTAEYETALFEASRIYGRAGCGDESLAVMTAKHAVSSGVPARLIAAQVAVESECNPLAVSNRGAVGLTQVVPKVWSKQYDFTKINLLNPEDNMTVYTSIVRELIKKYGVHGALARYYGSGDDGIGLTGAGYAERVLQLTGRL